MPLRFAILRTEGKLLLLLATELIILNPAALILIAEFPLFLLLLWSLEGGIYFKPIAVYMMIVLTIVIIGKKRFGEDGPANDVPVSKPLDSYPALQELVKRTASVCGRPSPRRVSMSLSQTPWHRFGVDLRRFQYDAEALPVPLSCMEIWSVSELEVHIARTLDSHGDASWPPAIIEAAIQRLTTEQHQKRLLGAAHWTVHARARLLQGYIDALNEWRFLVDMKADVNVARLLGVGTVMAFTYKTALAQALAPAFIASVIEPAIDKHALLPIAESYAAYAEAVDPHWRDAVNQKLKEMDRSPSSNSSSLFARLTVLSSLPPGFTLQDPRPAITLFSEFNAVAREVAANEFGSERVKSAVDADVGSSVRLSVIPQMRDEVGRNYALLEGKTPFDIPELLAAKERLAASYRTDPKLLLAHVQRVQRIPYLLGAFLALSLIDENWDIHYEIVAGIQLRLGERWIQPFTLVEQLDDKTISDADFAIALNSPSGPSMDVSAEG
jgi:hypothetical protein